MRLFPVPPPAVTCALFVALLCLPGAAHAQYRAVFLPLPTGITGGTALAIGDGQIAGQSSSLSPRALLWSLQTGAVTQLSTSASAARGVAGGVQAGNLGGGFPQTSLRATIWRGVAASQQNLHPFNPLPNFFPTQSQVNATNGTQHIGWGFGSVAGGAVRNRALFWSNHNADSAVDLTPAGFFSSEGKGIAGGQQVGFGGVTSHSDRRALLWFGTAASAVNLHPAEFGTSEALATDGVQQVGYGAPPVFFGQGPQRALLWSGSAGSVVNLHPSGFDQSSATAVRGGKQVGFGAITTPPFNITHALLWSGSAGSVVDLHAFLPAGTINSMAYGIDAFGNVVGTAGGRPVLWRAVTTIPEPGTLALAGIGLLPLLGRAARRRRA